MDHVIGYESVASRVKHEFHPDRMTYLCEKTGENLNVLYDYGKIKARISPRSLKDNRDYSVWRYAPLLPIRSLELAPPLQIGWTPLYLSRKLGPALGLSRLYFKDDGRNPSASYKDRASSVALVRARELGAEIVTGASTGNAGSSMACLCASVGMPAVIFVPENAPVAKLAQLLIFGARLFAVRGTYDDAFDLCLKVSQEFGWINRNTGYNPFTREGKKTSAYEIMEQLDWKVPDWVFVSVGDGNIISGVGKGFRDLLELGYIDKMPRLMAVQSDKSNAIYLSVKEAQKNPGEAPRQFNVSATTIADSISVDIPRDCLMAVRTVVESGGDSIEVSDEEILDAIKVLGRNEGIFVEPAASAAYAGVKKAARQGIVRSDETIVAILTGNGLKDVKNALKVAGEPEKIDPTLEAVKKALGK
jgi:threonine synthase